MSAPAGAVGTQTHHIVSSATGTGLQVSFLIMLSTLAAAGVFLVRARRSYPSDVATAGAAGKPLITRPLATPGHWKACRTTVGPPTIL